MAIRRTKEKESTNLPDRLAKLLEKGFTEQFMSSKFEELFKETKKDVVGYLESNEDGFDADLGKGFKCEQGTVIYTSRTNVSVDKDKLVQLVEEGKLSVGQLIACISTFKNEDLEKSLSTPVFNEVAKKSSSESLTFRGSAEFKAEMEEKLGAPVVPKAEPVPEKIVVKVDTKQVKEAAKENAAAKAKAAAEKSKDALASAKAAAARAKAKTKSAEDDLDEILGE